MHIRSVQLATSLCLGMAFTDADAAKQINLNNQSEPGGPYEISFCSRPSSAGSGQPGHAFVAFSSAGPGGTPSFKAVGPRPLQLGSVSGKHICLPWC